MRVLFDKALAVIKWPLAIYMLLSLPAYIQSLSRFQYTAPHHLVMIAGFVFFFFSRTMMDSSMRQSMETIAHELTHTFFAIITFHKVKSIRVNPDDTGGAMSFEGQGNWLITISPYFFPLFAFFVMIGISIYTKFAPSNYVINGILGFFVGYHLDTVGSQIHEKQTDLPKVSYKFCVMFLPSANIWAVGSIMAFNIMGWNGVYNYFRLINYLNLKNLDYSINLLKHIF